MKVKFTAAKFEYSGMTEGETYEVINKMESGLGGLWVEIFNNYGIVTLAKVGGVVADPFGTWEIVSE